MLGGHLVSEPYLVILAMIDLLIYFPSDFGCPLRIIDDLHHVGWQDIRIPLLWGIELFLIENVTIVLFLYAIQHLMAAVISDQAL